jgi:hypothetical protein
MREAKVYRPISRGHPSWTLPHPLCISRWQEGLQSPDERLQNILKTTRSHGTKPRSTTRRHDTWQGDHRSRVSNTERHKPSPSKSVHINNDPSDPKI